jgi:protein-tyrosine phosphatase
MDDRVWALEGVRNFRDFGGYPALGGRHVAKGRLFRSASFAGASAADIARLEALDVKFVVDLRRSHERENAPNLWPPQAARTIVYDGAAARAAAGIVEAPLHEAVAQVRRTGDEARAYMSAAYARYPYEQRFTRLFSDMFAAMAQDGGPFVVHCAAGKDRTGLACALVLIALGAPRATVFEDFLLTNKLALVSERLAAMRAMREKELGGPISDEELLPMIGVQEEYLRAALDVIEARSGSVDIYLQEQLGVDAAAREALAAHFLV